MHDSYTLVNSILFYAAEQKVNIITPHTNRSMMKIQGKIKAEIQVSNKRKVTRRAYSTQH